MYADTSAPGAVYLVRYAGSLPHSLVARGAIASCLRYIRSSLVLHSKLDRRAPESRIQYTWRSPALVACGIFEGHRGASKTI